MDFFTVDPREVSVREMYFLLTSLVVPRPIAWVSTVDSDGRRNLAPHSYFNICSQDPPVVHFTQGSLKDSVRNAKSTGEFVVNVVGADQLDAMNVTSAAFPPEEDEFAWAGVEAIPSDVVEPPRVAGSRAALECTVRDVLTIGSSHMVFGDVVRVHIANSIWRDGRVDALALNPLGRLGGSLYVAVDDAIRAPRPRWQDLQRGDASDGDTNQS